MGQAHYTVATGSIVVRWLRRVTELPPLQRVRQQAEQEQNSSFEGSEAIEGEKTLFENAWWLLRLLLYQPRCAPSGMPGALPRKPPAATCLGTTGLLYTIPVTNESCMRHRPSLHHLGGERALLATEPQSVMLTSSLWEQQGLMSFVVRPVIMQAYRDLCAPHTTRSVLVLAAGWI